MAAGRTGVKLVELNWPCATNLHLRSRIAAKPRSPNIDKPAVSNNQAKYKLANYQVSLTASAQISTPYTGNTVLIGAALMSQLI